MTSDGCWICGATAYRPFLEGTADLQVDPDALRITDAHYGRSAPLVQCEDCGFVYAHPLPADDLVALYADLDDPDYVEGRTYRLQQMSNLLAAIRRHAPDAATLLDVGAGTGLMVEAAIDVGLDAVGVEPATSLSEEARARHLPVHTGIHPHPALEGRTFDLVTCVDVIEHVTDPVGLLKALEGSLAPGGTLVVTTPDVESLTAKALGARWWHYRVAHVCFFPRTAMERALTAAGLQIVARERQVWWFSVGYLLVRLGALLGGEGAASALEGVASAGPLQRLKVPLDLRDSWVYVCRRAS